MKTILHTLSGVFLSFLLLFSAASCGTVALQGTDLRKADERQRELYLTTLSRKVIRTFGPGYYRKGTRPIITDEVFASNDQREEVARNVGRKYYKVTFPYDKSKETLDFDFSAYVNIWQDTGEVIEVIFGNGYGRNFFFIPYKEAVKDKTSIRPVPYQQATIPDKGIWIDSL